MRLRQLRRERELTQGELGRRVSLSTASISAIEAGRQTPPVDKAIEIAAFFGKPVEEVFGYVEVPA
jgi:putative transcriptional regulator